jgi:predicted Zn-dependent peptidase
MRTHWLQPAGFSLALLLCASVARSQDLASFEKRVSKKVLPNGLTVLVCERPEAPVFAFFTHVNVGADREVPGITGLAHMFEHMAFKGTDKIGTTNYLAEKAALARVEAAYAAYDRERRRPVGRDDQKVAALEKAWKDAIAAADQFVVKNEFGEIIEREGGAGLNAFTNWDETGYHYSFPSNRLELWAHLESERFLHPVMREFYKERDVVLEERRMRTDSSPTGRLIEQFLAAAYTAHAYGRPVVGYASDLQTFSATDALEFYQRYYIPSNMVVTVVGDVKPAQVFALAETYFGRLTKAPPPEPLRTVEPPQNAERQVILREAAQPWYVEGYHKPDARDKDEAVYDAISDLMSNGRVSRLHRSLVRDKQIAAFAGGFNDFPGPKYPNLFVFYAASTPGHTPDEIQAALHEEIDRIKKEDISDEELRMIQTRSRAALIRSLGDNEGLAQQLGTMEALFGDWRELFRQVERLQKVTKEDIRRVASQTFVASNRTSARIETQKPQGVQQ